MTSALISFLVSIPSGSLTTNGAKYIIATPTWIANAPAAEKLMCSLLETYNTYFT